nr:WxcM-like domain-containing protein [uncultured Allomuricauda sp.]
MPKPNLISGAAFKDRRGSLHFFNQFSMADIVRFYEIHPADTNIIRGWQGHREEEKWFYCIKGECIINLIQVDDFKNPNENSVATKYVLSESDFGMLHVPGGYATAFRAMEPDTKVQVFSNFTLDESKNDDFRYPLEYWSANWEK